MRPAAGGGAGALAMAGWAVLAVPDVAGRHQVPRVACCEVPCPKRRTLPQVAGGGKTRPLIGESRPVLAWRPVNGGVSNTILIIATRESHGQRVVVAYFDMQAAACQGSSPG